MPAPGVLGNDVDPDGDPLTATLVSGPAHGTLTFNPDGSFVYTPDANYSGPDSFTYTVNDGDQTSTPATVTLTVSPVNDPPTAVADTYSLGEDHTLSVPASSGLLANDSDIDPSSALTAVLVTGPAHGTLTLNPDGSFTYVPDPNFNGVDTFTYQVSDGTATSTPATVTLNVGDDVTLSPGAGRDTGGTRVTIEGTGFGPAGTPVTVTIGGVPALEAEVLDDGHITFVTPALPPGTPVDVVFVVNNGPPETLPGAYLPLPVPAAGDPTDTDGDGITDEIELKYGLDPTNPADAGDDPDHDGVPSNTEIINGTHPNAPYLRYFAEGINNTVFNTGIAVANASAATMEVQLTFFRQGQAPVRKNLTLTGRTRLMLNTATVPGMANAAFGVEVAGNEAVSADRTTFWDLGGREAHSEHAVEASPTWYFAEGATTGRFSLFYLLTNPSSQPANATVTFLRQVGAPIVKQMVVPGYARVTIPVGAADPGLVSADVGGIVSADRPIVVERSMYLSSPSKIWEAGTGGTGVTAPADPVVLRRGRDRQLLRRLDPALEPGLDRRHRRRPLRRGQRRRRHPHAHRAGRPPHHDPRRRRRRRDDEHLVRHLRDLDQRGAGRRRARHVVALERGPLDGRARRRRLHRGRQEVGDGGRRRGGRRQQRHLRAGLEHREPGRDAEGHGGVRRRHGAGRAAVRHRRQPALHHPRAAALPGGRRQGLQLHHRIDRRRAGRHRRRPLDLLRHGRALLGDRHHLAGFEDQVAGIG